MMKINDLRKNLDFYIPNPKCELNYTKDYELLIAVMLSAQCTDKRVNEVTPNLFKYTLMELANLDIKVLEKLIRPLGSYHKKSVFIKDDAKILLEKYNGIVPNDRKKLESMPGIGRKCSNVILSELFNIPTIAVDTHVERVSKRLGLVSQKDTVYGVEQKLLKTFKKDEYNKINHQLLLFGRYYCKAKNPLCDNCKMNCKFKQLKKMP